ncbi:hypothetical protein C365_01369 [Cryptococcus neoformans Bt85]|nr:hypothetical protein C365_01369 [Cryptococcus neoformans var. grubii Bt85]
MPPRRYPLDTSAQAPTASQYSKTLQSKTPAKRPLQQASNTTQRGTGEAVGHDKCIERAEWSFSELDSIESDDLESEEDVEELQRRPKAIKTNYYPSSLALKALNLGLAALKKDSWYGVSTTAQKSKATVSSIPTIMYASSIVHFVLSMAPKIDNVDITVHDMVYHSGIFVFRSLEDVDQQAICQGRHASQRKSPTLNRRGW